MFDFFVEGGWGMWPILVFGMVTVGAGLPVRPAARPGKLKFIAAMGLTTLVATIHATWIDLGAVFSYLSDPAKVPDARLRARARRGAEEHAARSRSAGCCSPSRVCSRRWASCAPAGRRDPRRRGAAARIRERRRAARPRGLLAPGGEERAGKRDGPGPARRATLGAGAVAAHKVHGQSRARAADRPPEGLDASDGSRGRLADRRPGGVGARRRGHRGRRARPRHLRPLAAAAAATAAPRSAPTAPDGGRREDAAAPAPPISAVA